ncbi:hypothetical protein POM88_010622 [Heracleum sosnowskyi]|uniref:DC1 domain-containing protein n=1 Tax=Heracleum sosnowskyi TaxID=360622 RepID=A0AAD8ITV0_9APIA|nr:hypothetical protein POM88_010622 [Heracleum sosnowskyi]
MEHSSHPHPLILNQNYIAGEGDVCHGCREQVISSKSFVYCCTSITGNTDSSTTAGAECAEFLLHKSCAELPQHIQIPTKSQKFLQLRLITNTSAPREGCCNICAIPMAYKVKQFFYFSFYDSVCIKCAILQVQLSLEDPKIDHPAHPQHPVALIQHPTSFKCYACNIDDNIRDMSYRCTRCQFWMHKSCGDAPTSFQFQFHSKHPLILKFSLPLVYQKFHQYCKLCNVILGRSEWLYCCYNCRFFVHFHCARSSRILSMDENENHDSSLVHLPAANTLSINLLLERFVKGMISTLNNNNDSTCSVPSHIQHWAHVKHHLQLIAINELRDPKDDDENVLLCYGCTKPIRIGDDSFYGCVTCKFFLHKFCAELPKMIKHHLWPGKTFFARSAESFICNGCNVECSGISFSNKKRSSFFSIRLHVGCMTLPKTIKHEAHSHPLEQVYTNRHNCKACREFRSYDSRRFMYGCKQCEDYYICTECSILRPGKIEHRWDPHSLELIYEPGMVENHEHEFSCEFCSKDINTNRWFYHCSHCDLSFHLEPCSVLDDCLSESD